MVAKYFINYGERNIPTDFTTGKTFREVNKELKKMDVGILVKFLETDSSVFLYSKYKESGIISIYNKNSQSTLSYIQELNDVNVLFPNSVISTSSGDSLIGYWDSFYFTSLKKLYNNIAGDEKKIKPIAKERFENLPEGEHKTNLLKALDKANFHLKQADINFVNTIKETDNPIIVIRKLKKDFHSESNI